MRVRETKYPSGKAVLTAVQWNGGFHQAYRDGKLLPKDMPDQKTEVMAGMVEMYMTLAENRWENLKEVLEGMPDEQD